jgi:tetratricopeptide (TPR) repeat protein
MSEQEEKASEKQESPYQTRGFRFVIGTVASALLTGLASEMLNQSLDSGGWVQWVGLGVTVLLGAITIIQYGPAIRRSWQHSGESAPELHTTAEEAEQWMIALGSHAGGMAAAEWYALNEEWLRELLMAEKPHADTIDDFARICDALEAWYVRRADPDALLQLSDLLSAAAEVCGRRDLAELAAARAATAYRMLGDLDTASTRLGISDNIATHTRTAAAMTTRRQVERALLSLARADRSPAGNDRDEAVLNARERLDEARLKRPGPDLAADIAIAVNLAVVHLYQQDAEGALDHLRPAVARATAAGDLSGQAHALELMGVAAWMQRNPHEAVSRWDHAAHLYAEIDEREGHARCLQHLGSAEVVAGRMTTAVELLEQSAMLRRTESEILVKYLDAARQTSDVPVVTDDAPRRTATWLRRRLRSLKGFVGRSV